MKGISFCIKNNYNCPYCNSNKICILKEEEINFLKENYQISCLLEKQEYIDYNDPMMIQFSEFHESLYVLKKLRYWSRIHDNR